MSQALRSSGNSYRAVRSRARSILALVVALASINIWPPNVDAADMDKVVHHVFPAAEEGFDPRPRTNCIPAASSRQF
jgi:hypothetical protein